MHFEIDMIPNEDQLRKEARERMEMLKMYPQFIDDYVNNGQLWTSSNCLRKPKPEELEHVRAFEKEFGNRIYHPIRGRFMDCEVLNMLSISPYMEDWEYERNLIRKGCVMSRSENLSIPDWSESGIIFVRNESGVLRRWG
jgi:hypothetical protein